MRDIALPLQDFLHSLDEDAHKSCRAQRINQAFARAIRDVYGVDAMGFILSNVQAVYVMKDDGTYVGDAKPPRLLRIYTSDPMVRADLDARQEFIKMNLARQGIGVDKVKLHASTFGMKERAPFQDLLERMAQGQVVFEPEEGGDAYRYATEQDMSKLLQVLKVALCQVFREDAELVVKPINVAYVKPCAKNRHEVALYAEDQALLALLNSQEGAICAHMRDLGVPAVRLRAEASEDWMCGYRAFPSMAAPVVVLPPE